MLSRTACGFQKLPLELFERKQVIESDEPSYERAGRNIKSRIANGDACGISRDQCSSLEFEKLGTGTLLDFDVITTGQLTGILHECIERQSVLFRQQGNRVGADFIDYVAVLRAAVGAHDHSIDLLTGEHLRNATVRNYRNPNASLGKLPGGQARPLEIGAGFCRHDG